MQYLQVNQSWPVVILPAFLLPGCRLRPARGSPQKDFYLSVSAHNLYIIYSIEEMEGSVKFPKGFGTTICHAENIQFLA